MQFERPKRIQLSRLAIALGATVCMAASAGTAKADTIQAFLFTPTAPVGGVMTTVALPNSALGNTNFSGPGYSVTFSGVAGNEGVVNGTLANTHAVPVAGISGGSLPQYLTGDFGSPLTTNINNSGNYLSTGAPGTITINFTATQFSLALLWGSIDTTNQLSLSDGTTYTGTQVQTAAAGFISNGFQGPGGSAYIIINSPGGFNSISLSSGVVSFELSAIAADTAAFVGTPEPSSFALLAIGFGMIAVAGIRRRKINARVLSV